MLEYLKHSTHYFVFNEIMLMLFADVLFFFFWTDISFIQMIIEWFESVMYLTGSMSTKIAISLSKTAKCLSA